ncbi:unnamed protein product [Schistocephalus solidus]|uniref:Uncharacterized protein n=1 Tax=Schistocephalus solidus TaxID=70667 RepID=A0A183T370_SCHSO|nr:unnamed protein product [Schistocephalus solidus]
MPVPRPRVHPRGLLLRWKAGNGVGQQDTRPRVHPRGLLLRWKAGNGVGQQETVFRTRAQKKEAVIVAATETVGTQHSLPGSVVRPDAGIEVTKDN